MAVYAAKGQSSSFGVDVDFCVCSPNTDVKTRLAGETADVARRSLVHFTHLTVRMRTPFDGLQLAVVCMQTDEDTQRTASLFAKTIINEVLTDPHINDRAQGFIMDLLKSPTVQTSILDALLRVLSQKETRDKVSC